MKNAYFLSSLAIALLLASAAGLHAQTWTAGGANANWNNTDNWSDGVPLADGNVTVDRTLNTTMTVALNVEPASLNNWSSNASLGNSSITVTPSASGNRTLTINGTLTKSGLGGLTFRSNPLSTLPLEVTIGTAEHTDVTDPSVLGFGTVNNELASLNITTANVSKLTGTGNNQLVFNPAANTVNYTIGTLNMGTGGAFFMANSSVAGNNYAVNVGSLNGAGGVVRAANGASRNATVSLNLTGESTGSYTGVINNGSAITRVVKSGTATQTLGNAGNNYTGGTAITGGTLVVSVNNSIGAASGNIEISGADAATLRINSGISVGNNIIYSNTNALSALEITIADSGAFRTGTSGNFSSSFAGGTPDTTAAFLAGSATAIRTLNMGFAATSAATNDAIRKSDVFSLTGTANDVFVLQLSATGLDATDFLGWLDGSNEWVSAVDGNTGSGDLAGAYSISWAAFVADNGNSFNSTTMLGAYGNDGSGNVWAVLNHNSDFTVIPEPGTWALLAGALALGIVVLRRRRW